MSFHRIRRQEAPGVGLIVPRPQVVRAQVGVVLLAAIQIRVRRRAGLMQDHAVGVIRITVGDVPRRVAQSPHAPQAVGMIIARRAHVSRERWRASRRRRGRRPLRRQPAVAVGLIPLIQQFALKITSSYFPNNNIFLRPHRNIKIY